MFLLERVAEVKRTGARFERRAGLDGKGLVHAYFWNAASRQRVSL